ncbi:MAG: hypothetical protein IKS67_16110, partial [Victivallales bacterium]|nr:hypothetical protein [Victivallales bacterium]
ARLRRAAKFDFPLLLQTGDSAFDSRTSLTGLDNDGWRPDSRLLANDDTYVIYSLSYWLLMLLSVEISATSETARKDMENGGC